MNNLTLTQQGVNGGTPRYSANVGRIVAGTDSGIKIEVDAFTGFGDTYRRRAEHLITITSKGETVFTGTSAELLAKLLTPAQPQRERR